MRSVVVRVGRGLAGGLFLGVGLSLLGWLSVGLTGGEQVLAKWGVGLGALVRTYLTMGGCAGAVTALLEPLGESRAWRKATTCLGAMVIVGGIVGLQAGPPQGWAAADWLIVFGLGCFYGLVWAHGDQ